MHCMGEGCLPRKRGAPYPPLGGGPADVMGADRLLLGIEAAVCWVPATHNPLRFSRNAAGAILIADGALRAAAADSGPQPTPGAGLVVATLSAAQVGVGPGLRGGGLVAGGAVALAVGGVEGVGGASGAAAAAATMQVLEVMVLGAGFSWFS